MGLILDTSVLIAAEKRRLDFYGLVNAAGGDAQDLHVCSIAISELMQGVIRANTDERRERRLRHARTVQALCHVLPFDLADAEHHARIWADLASRGKMIGPYDLIIAATALAREYTVATLNAGEFTRVTGLKVFDAIPWLIA